LPRNVNSEQKVASKRGKKGEIITYVVVVVIAVVMLGTRMWQQFGNTTADPGIPFYSTASHELATSAGILIRRYHCKQCHSLWATRTMLQSVPAPRLDGIGTLRDKTWLTRYLSSDNPQAILPSRLKPEYRMPSYAHIPEKDRQTLVDYLSSLKVKDWYRDDTRRSEYEKLTGREPAQ